MDTDWAIIKNLPGEIKSESETSNWFCSFISSTTKTDMSLKLRPLGYSKSFVDLLEEMSTLWLNVVLVSVLGKVLDFEKRPEEPVIIHLVLNRKIV